jgi:uncharacterized membrane protein
MLRIAITYVAMALAFAGVDYVWLTKLGPGVYHPILDEVLLPNPPGVRLDAAVAFYLAYIAGILALAVWPNRTSSLMRTTLTGAVLGAMCYATYDLTNQSTLRVWATSITLADLAWGTFITAWGATVGGWVLRRLSAPRSSPVA